MALTYRSVKGSALTIAELDGNFEHFTGSQSITGSITATSFTGSLLGTASTSSYIQGSSVDGIVATATTALTSSFVSSSFGMLSPNGTRYEFTVNDSGHLLLTGSTV
tara:strand:+ start:592 stop:912 length:321 start_codon:yes stop_codon:yes gene_type:complete